LKNRINLSLTNFRNHSNADFSFPETGMVRIDGKSGVGKSSIFKAVSYALYGKQNKITTWNEETTEVDLAGFGLSIVRGRGPNILKVNGLSSSTAQNEIENTLGMNKTEFDICSYVAQNQKNSLINLSPSEQMELINELAFKGSDPFKQKEEIAEKIKEVGALLNQLETKENNVKEKTDEIKNAIKSLKQTLFNITDSEESIKTKLKKYNSQIGKLEEKVQNLKIKRKVLTDNKNHPAREVFQPASDFLKKYSDSLQELTDKQKMCQAHLSQYKEQSIQNQLAESNLQIKNLKSECNKLEWLQNQLQNLERYKEQKDTSLNKIFETIDGLNLYGEPEIIDKILSLKLDCEDFLSHHDAIQSISISNFEDEIKNKINKCKKNIKTFETAANQLEETLKDIQKHKFVLEETENSLNQLQKKKNKADEILKANETLIPIVELEQEIQQIYEEIEKHSSELNLYSAKRIESESVLGQITKNNEISEKIHEYENKLIALNKTIKQLESEREEAKKLFSGCSEIAEIWQKSMLESLEGIIDEINFRATYWLDILLDGRVKAQLKTSRKLKSKDKEISTINLELICDGQVLDTLSEDDLSGGQFSRLVLAFQLALSDMYNSPILMLDESLQGCDIATQEICIDAIKEISDRKLVLMIEHYTQDHYFDEVLYIE